MVKGHLIKKITSNVCCLWVHMKAMNHIFQMRYGICGDMTFESAAAIMHVS